MCVVCRCVVCVLHVRVHALQDDHHFTHTHTHTHTPTHLHSQGLCLQPPIVNPPRSLSNQFCVCIYACMCVRMHVYASVYVYVCIHMCICVHLCNAVYIHVYVYVRACMSPCLHGCLALAVAGCRTPPLHRERTSLSHMYARV